MKKIRMLRGRRLVHLILIDGEDAVLACNTEYDVFGYRAFQDAGECIPDDTPLTCKHCQRIEARR